MPRSRSHAGLLALALWAGATGGARAEPTSSVGSGVEAQASLTEADAVDLQPAKAAVGASDIDARRSAELGHRLTAVEAELDADDTLLPWAVIVLGLAATATALTTATVDVLACERSCSTGVWQSLTVVAGATLTSVGAVWLTNVHEDRRQLDLRRDRIERELQNIRDNRALSVPAAGLRLGARF